MNSMWLLIGIGAVCIAFALNDWLRLRERDQEMSRRSGLRRSRIRALVGLERWYGDIDGAIVIAERATRNPDDNDTRNWHIYLKLNPVPMPELEFTAMRLVLLDRPLRAIVGPLSRCRQLSGWEDWSIYGNPAVSVEALLARTALQGHSKRWDRIEFGRGRLSARFKLRGETLTHSTLAEEVATLRTLVSAWS